MSPATGEYSGDDAARYPRSLHSTPHVRFAPPVPRQRRGECHVGICGSSNPLAGACRLDPPESYLLLYGGAVECWVNVDDLPFRFLS